MNRDSRLLRAGNILAGILLAVAYTASAEEPQPPTPRLSESTRPLHYEAELRLDPRQPEFEGTIEIRLVLEEATDLIWLNGTELDIRSWDPWRPTPARRTPTASWTSSPFHRPATPRA